MNCRGLAQQQKRREVLNFLTTLGAEITFLQETHLTNRTSPYFDTVWSGKCFHSYYTANSRGTTILMKASLSYDLISEEYSEDGNMVCIVCKINNNIFTLINLYGPNDDTPSFYKQVDKILQKYPQENVIIGGDFNFVIDRIQDSNYENDNNVHAKKTFIKICEKHSLIDIWRCKHPDEHEYTWVKNTPLKFGRLDMFFC